MIKEHERVVLKTDLPVARLEAGDVGTVVHIYRGGLACEVEFTTLDGNTAAVVTVEAAQVRPVGKRGITSCRRLDGPRCSAPMSSENPRKDSANTRSQ